MNNPKRQHYIPRLILKRFANEDGQLFACAREKSNLRYFKTSLDNLFVQSNLYTVDLESGEKDFSTESKLSKLETKAEKVLVQLVEFGERFAAPNLSPANKLIWDRFLTAQIFRTPEITQDSMTNEKISRQLNEVIRSVQAKFGTIPKDVQEQFYNAANIARMKKMARNAVISNPSGLVLSTLQMKGLAVAAIPKDTNKSFVVGSYPIARFADQNGDDHLGRLNMELWFPISSKIAVSPFGFPHERKTISLTDTSLIRKINRRIADQSTYIAATNEPLLRSITNPR